ncbi:hypothetical protein MMC08_007213 [Hypocenomyce scalaris]|nr:hypothetical protein [Hypocenomyce scalaris]
MGFSSSLLSALLPVAVAPVSGDTNPDVGSFEETLRKKSIDYAYAENIQGMSQEALLFLKRGSPDSWGPWEDYDRYVPMLAELEGHLPCANKLKVDVFYSETDVMIGTSRGPQWFDACWRSERRGDRIEYSSCTIMGADHDSILDLKFGLPRRIFDEIANSFLP